MGPGRSTSPRSCRSCASSCRACRRRRPSSQSRRGSGCSRASPTFLTNAARAQPLVLILDNLHWADEPSLLLLQFLARELRTARLLVLGTYRDAELGRQHPLSPGTLAELGPRTPASGSCCADRRAGYRPLHRDDDAAVATRLAADVYRETEGNLFFVAEIVRLLASRGTSITTPTWLRGA